MAKKAKKEVLETTSKKSKGTKKKTSVGKKIAQFFKDCKKEIKRITWPTGKTVLKNTVVVLIVVALAGAILYFFDFGMSSALKAVKGAADSNTTTTSASASAGEGSAQTTAAE